MRKNFCSTCGDFVSSFIQNTTETFHVRGINNFSSANLRKLRSDEILDDEKLKLVQGMLQPEEIKEIREKRNLTQEEFSKILGFNVARYENGSLQSEEEDKRLVKDFINRLKNQQNFTIVKK